MIRFGLLSYLALSYPSLFNLESFERKDRTSPMRLFDPRVRFSSSTRLPSSSGIFPESFFP